MESEDREAVRLVLQRVIASAGPDVVRDRARTIGLLRDGARNRFRPLIDLLIRALDSGIPASFSGAKIDGRPISVIERDGIARLVAETMSDRDAATWAVGAWKSVLAAGGDDGG